MTIHWEQLPQDIQKYKDQILATAQPCAQIELVQAADLTLWQSKVGGLAYLLLNEHFPVDAKGVPLKFLAQINFAEMPELADYPRSGLLQFFIGGDDLYGADFNHLQQQDGFRIKFYEKVIEDPSQLQQDFSDYLKQTNDTDYYSPITGQSAITFQAETHYISTDVFDFGPRVLSVEDIWDYEEQFKGDDFNDDWLEPYNDTFESTGHRVGGYPYFTQTDPREDRDEIKAYVLLLQIDSETTDAMEVMWGDCGVANFFIHPDDLKKRDFSKVVYNWDCG